MLTPGMDENAALSTDVDGKAGSDADVGACGARWIPMPSGQRTGPSALGRNGDSGPDAGTDGVGSVMAKARNDALTAPTSEQWCAGRQSASAASSVRG
jgi:hypothetical protein